MNILPIDRKEARKRAEDNSKHNDMKQHADKLIQGFQKLSDKHAKRAIWELFQNAIDLSEQAVITIEHTDDALIFKHNGKPFDDNTLNCLIKQVSSKSTKNNDDEIGQYGTGFITTHSFGRKILISGSLENASAYLTLNQFALDRTSRESQGLIDALIKQQDMVFDLIENGDYLDKQEPLTEFAYQTESVLQKTYAEEAINSLPAILPYVMVLNQKLHKVLVKEKTGKETLYERGNERLNGSLVESEIRINEKHQHIYSIQCPDPQITVILPFKEHNLAYKFDEQLSKLFLYYPLIGTEQFGVNFIIHSKEFSPTEQREGIYLKSNIEQIQDDEAKNRELIENASKIIFSFIEKNATTIRNPIYLAQINFDILSDKEPLNEYMRRQKGKWTKQFEKFQLVESDEGLLSPSQTVFIHSELLQCTSYYESIYNLVSRYWKNVPKKDIAKDWTLIIDDWNSDSAEFINIEKLASKIEKEINLAAFDNLKDLQLFYQFLIDRKLEGIFGRFKLLPNQKGEFRQLSDLCDSSWVPNMLIEIADTIMPNTSRRYIRPDFKFNLDLTPYNSNNYTTDLNSQIAKDLKDDCSGKKIHRNYLEKLLEYCRLTTRTENTSTPLRMMNLICDYYNVASEVIILPAINDSNIENRSAQKRVLRIFLNDLSKEESRWAALNIKKLKNIISVGATYSEYEDLFQTMSVFPNQLMEMTSQSYLVIDDNIPEEIKDLFDKIVNPNLPVRSNLVHPEFTKYLKSQEKKTVRHLTDEIESIFSGDGQYSNVSQHRFRNEILDVIKTITTNSSWAGYFPILNSKRANIILDTVSNDKIKGDVFSIVSLDPDKIKMLGELARNAKNIEAIISLGTNALEEVHKTKTDFQFKHAIGKKIEVLINEKIKRDLDQFSINVQDVQNGQDIVISDHIGNDIYFIEVKSRWSTDSSIMMSKNQFTNAAKNKTKYSLCCVEMSDFKRGLPERYEVEDIKIIFDRIKIISTIGEEIEPLINGLISTTDIENEITLTGDYKATIPQRLIKKGVDINTFVGYLISRLNLQ